jgi:hypothetical protein
MNNRRFPELNIKNIELQSDSEEKCKFDLKCFTCNGKNSAVFIQDVNHRGINITKNISNCTKFVYEKYLKSIPIANIDFFECYPTGLYEKMNLQN